MTDRPPPFSALRAVEAASRHRSFTWAAKELRITHSAVSQSIRRLEAELGTPLFQRKGGAMEPSEAALRLAESYHDAARSLGRTLREITGGSRAGVLTVAMPADFGRLWFGAKLARLAEALPDLRIEVRTTDSRDHEADSDVVIDLAATEGREADVVGPELLCFPVCGPDYLAARRLDTPRQVVRAPLIAGGGCDWGGWTEHFAVASRPPAYAFDDAGMALDAAARGAGVALTHLFAAEGHLETGRLVALPFAVPTGRHLLLSAGPGQENLAARFAMWLRLEASRSLALQQARMKKV